MNMKYSLVFIIVLGLLCGCVRQRKADASDTGSIEMTQSETDALTADSRPTARCRGHLRFPTRAGKCHLLLENRFPLDGI